MLIAGFHKTTLLDYPGRVAATIFVGGCNFRCPFCHNGGLVLEPLSQESWSEGEILDYLAKRKNVLKGVCVTGGEPTLHADLPAFLAQIKALGYLVKLDTNGYAPKVLEGLLEEHCLDYVAMDIKNCKDKYAMTAGIKENFQIERIEASIQLLKNADIPWEFRTTVVKELHTIEDLTEIVHWIRGCPRYFLQQYRDNAQVICRDAFSGYTKEEMEEMAESLRQIPEMADHIFLRGTE